MTGGSWRAGPMKNDTGDPQMRLREKDGCFVLFYATWCPFSRRFLPAFEKWAEKGGHDCLRITSDENPGLFEKYSIEVMPTVIFFKKGRPARRLDATPHVGLSEKQLLDLIRDCI